MTVGEAACVTLEEAKKYAGEDRGELDTVFQFEHTQLGDGVYGKWNDAPIKLTELKAVFDKWERGLDGISWNTLFWSNHDQPRAVSRFGEEGKYWKLSAKMLGTCMHMMKGTPYIYQCEEIGMLNAGFTELSEYRDVESINAYHELVEKQGVPEQKMMEYLRRSSRDNARTPMQWDSSAQAGFTTGEPWIKVNANYTRINAKAQMNDPNSIYNYYQKLIKLRHEQEIIVYGDFKMLIPESEEIFAYRRTLGESELLVLCNFTGQNVDIPFETAGYRLLLGNYKERCEEQLRPYEAVILQK